MGSLIPPETQGSVLLQAILRMPEPHYAIVTDSLSSLGVEEVIKLAHNATSSRVLDAVLESATVSLKAKRAFVMSFIGSYHLLADDRIGSRVADRCWELADPYLRVRNHGFLS